MEQAKRATLTADEFIAWAMEQPEGRYELDDGVVVAMAPERAAHNQAKLNAVIALRSAIDRAALACRAMTDGMSVRVNDHTVYEPDALVRCGAPLPGDAVEVADPVVVVEVVSPSSGGVDRGVKLVGYFMLPSLRHYLIVDTDRRVVIHHRRDDADEIVVRIVREGALTLDPPGLTVAVADIFADL
jgi:Uma2 family endonuclease